MDWADKLREISDKIKDHPVIKDIKKDFDKDMDDLKKTIKDIQDGRETNK